MLFFDVFLKVFFHVFFYSFFFFSVLKGFCIEKNKLFFLGFLGVF